MNQGQEVGQEEFGISPSTTYNTNAPVQQTANAEAQNVQPVVQQNAGNAANVNAIENAANEEFEDEQAQPQPISENRIVVSQPSFGQKVKLFLTNNFKKILIILIIIAVIYVLFVAKKEGYIKIPFANGDTAYVKQSKDKSENKASAVIEDANGNVIYTQTTQPVSRINYDYEQILPEESSHGAISIESI